MKLLLGSLVAQVNGIEFSLDDGMTSLAGFVTDGHADFVVDAVVGGAPGTEKPSWEFSPGVVSRDGRQVAFHANGNRAVVDLDARHVDVSLRGPWTVCLDNILAPVAQVMSLELRRGAILHSSSVVGEGLAAVFLGRSGAGKTTAGVLARMAGAELISEELTYLALEPHGARLYSLPFRQKNRLTTPVPGAYPLSAFYALQQDECDAVEHMSRGEGMRRLLVSAVVGVRDRALTVPALEVCEALADRVPVRRLRFRKTPAFWQMVKEDMRATVMP